MTDVSDFPIIPYTTVPDTSPPGREERERMQALAFAFDVRHRGGDFIPTSSSVVEDAKTFLAFLQGDHQ